MEKPCNICDNCKYGAAECENGARFEIDLAPGYRFKPTESELLIHYLNKKIRDEPLPSNVIRQFNVYSEDPDLLEAIFKSNRDENAVEMYFFTPRDRKYTNGYRPNRSAKNGTWKASGRGKPIIHNGKVIGKKQSLGFYRGKSAKQVGEKTDWLMHEYRLDGTQLPKGSGDNGMKLDDFVLCKIYKKERKAKPNAENNTNEANNKEHAADVTNIHTTGINNDVTDMGNNNFQIQNFVMNEQVEAQNQHDQLLAAQYSPDFAEIEKVLDFSDLPHIQNGALFTELPNLDFLDF